MMMLPPMLAEILKRRRRRKDRHARPGAEGLEGRALLATIAPSYGYALDLGGTTLQTWGHAVAVDGDGDAVVTGHFLGTTDFDPNNPTDTAATVTTPSYTTSDGQLRYASNAYIGRYGPTGNLLWLRVIGNVDGGSGEKVAIDAAGDVYAAGEFNGTVTFGAGADGNPVSLTSPGTGDIYLVKYDPGGTVQWANAIGGGNQSDSVRALAVDGAGDVFLSASFSGSTVVGGHSMTYTGGTNYLTRYGAGGNFAWVDQLAASINGLAVDASGNPYLTGGFGGTVDFDPGPKTYSLYSGGRKVQPSGTSYVEKLNADGTFAWADAFQGGNWTLANGAAIAVDGQGNVYSTGFYEDTIDFNPSSKVSYPLTSVNASNDVYVSKLDSRGQFVWAKSLGGPNADYAYGLAIDPGGNIDLTGEFSGTADFDPGSGTSNLTATPAPTVFVAQLNDAGAFDWALSLGSTGEARPSGLAVDGAGDVFTTGFFSGTADFDPGPDTQDRTSQSSVTEDAFLWKLSPTSQAAALALAPASASTATDPAASGVIQPLDASLDDLATDPLRDQKRRSTAGAG